MGNMKSNHLTSVYSEIIGKPMNTSIKRNKLSHCNAVMIMKGSLVCTPAPF